MSKVKIDYALAQEIFVRLDEEIEIAEPEAWTERAQYDVKNLWKMHEALQNAIAETNAVSKKVVEITDVLAKALSCELDKESQIAEVEGWTPENIQKLQDMQRQLAEAIAKSRSIA